jgi:glycosyltransferase involved in cell wall biosynthesis
MRVTACLIVKNEEVMLDACLSSLKGLDEIIVLDTGSTDRTILVARKHTSRVFQDYKWRDHFADARNHALTKCTGDWILSIDADEQLESNGVEKIRRVIGLDNQVISVIMASGANRFHFPRLFRKSPEIYWEGAVHECLNQLADYHSDIQINYGYSPAHQTDPDRALRILKQEMERDPNLVREMFYLAREYVYRSDWPSAIYYYEQYVKRASWKPELAEGYYQLAKAYRHMDRLPEARQSCLNALSINPNFKSACLLMAELAEPGHRARWLSFAEGATNEDVLFTCS